MASLETISKKQIASASNDPDAAFTWYIQVETANDIESLADAPPFNTLDAKIGAELYAMAPFQTSKEK